jgi:exonuclease III
MKESVSTGLESQTLLRNKSNFIIWTYNIIYGGNSRMALAMETMRTMKINVGILTETKVAEGIYTKAAHGYSIVATEAQSNYQGVALFYKSDNK